MRSKMLVLSIFVLLLIPHTIVFAQENSSAEQVIEQRYHLILNEWLKKDLDSIAPFERAIPPSSFTNIDETDLQSVSESHGYGDRVFYWRNQESLTIEVEVNKAGVYEIGFDYLPQGNLIIPIEGAIQVNSQYPFSESRRVLFPAQWKSEQEDFEVDPLGNDILPEQVTIDKWLHLKVEDSGYLYKRPFKFYLEKGTNTISLKNLRGEMLVGNVYITSPTEIPSYEAYQISYPDAKQQGELQIYEAEHPLEKNSSYIRPVATDDPSVEPYDVDKVQLNTFGGESWYDPGQTVSWKVDVEKEGFYQLSFKVLQDRTSVAPVYRTVMINDKIPFLEMEQYQFPYNKNWYNETLSNDDGEAYLFYLEKGENKISLKADPSPNGRVIFAIKDVMKEIDELSLQIRKLTGSQSAERDWKINEYIPGIDQQLLDWADTLQQETDYLLSLNNGEDTLEIVSLQMAIEKLKNLAAEPDEIPERLTELSTGSSSAAQLLGDVSTDLNAQPLLIDRFYVHGDNVSLPEPEAGFFTKSKNAIVSFFKSFSQDNLAISDVDDDTVEVWVNRPRQYVELLQNMTDQIFTPQTGIKVKYSLMPNEQKLVLASAADTQPDLAFGISNWVPYELAIRGAAVDLRQFDDFNEIGKQFSPGAFLPMIVEDGVYALPETQDFFVQYYRKDILNELNIPIPNTWDEVTQILPELQRYGLNYYIPLAQESAFKSFQTTAPFIYQFGGDLYKDNGFGTTIDEEAALAGIQFMADLNTIYSMPLQVPKFYNDFRYSTLPIGVAPFATYVELTTAAPEISGWWDITPMPGKEQEDGTIARWAPGSGQASMIFDGDKTDKAWEVLKWWMSTETQTDFARSLQMLFGPEYMWNTANLEAFKQLPLPDEHKKVIIEQWKYLYEVPKTPYSYLVEREISNVWNRAVFNGENVRSAVDDSVILIDREMRRKLTEFGYVKNGEMVKPYPIPTIEKVKGWLEGNEE
ncbi:extracellular solute-binding protein [Bacillaceae bacterium S4-13-56]